MSDRRFKGKQLSVAVSDFCVVDVETTGMKPSACYVIEIGAIRYRNLQPVDEFQMLIRPPQKSNGKYVGREIQNLTGINNDMLSRAYPTELIYPLFRKFLGDDIIVGHNVNFDVNFLYDTGRRIQFRPLSNNYIDTLQLARHYLKGKLEHFSLSDVSLYFEIVNRRAHRALCDCEATGECYLKLREMMTTFGW